MAHWLTSALVLCLLGCQQLSAQPQAAQSLDSVALKRTESVTDTPAGQTRRIEYKRIEQGDVVRVEFVHLLAGRVIFGQTTVVVDEKGRWLLTNSNSDMTTRFFPSTKTLNEACKSVPTSALKSVLNVISTADFQVNGVLWRAHITHIYEKAKPQAGISTETEAAVDIVACKLANLQPSSTS